MLSVQDRENIMGWAYVWLKDAAWTNTRATYCDVEPVCCDDIAKVWFLICLINRSVGVIDDSDIELLYQRLQCLIGLSTVTTCPENCFPCGNPDQPTPTPTGCTLQVGSGCCDYSVEGIELITSSCFQIIFPNEFAYGNEGFMVEVTLEVLRDEPATNHIFFQIQYIESEKPTITELLSDIQSNFDDDGGRYVLTTGDNWYQICDTQSDVFGQVTGIVQGSFEDATENNIEFYGLFNFPPGVEPETLPELQGGFDFRFGIDNANTTTFQVLINDVWTDVTDEIVDGTWQRTNVCDDVITEWRIIDSEGNVINSGDVTATCEGATEVTDSVCNWLQAHQTAIEELQAGGGGGGLTCETLSECQTIIDIEQTLTEKANTADLATVATTGSYNDLTDQPTIPAAQIQSDWNQANNAALDFIKNKPTLATVATSGAYSDLSGLPTIPTNNNELTNGAGYITSAALDPLAFFSGTAGHTGDANETIVQTIAIPSTAWATNAVYQILARVTRIAGAVTFRVRFNTTPDLAGTPITILEFSTSAGSSNPNRLLIKTGNSFEYSTLTTISDLTGLSTTATATVSTATTIYIMLTIQGSTSAANGNFSMLNITRQ